MVQTSTNSDSHASRPIGLEQIRFLSQRWERSILPWVIGRALAAREESKLAVSVLEKGSFFWRMDSGKQSSDNVRPILVHGWADPRWGLAPSRNDPTSSEVPKGIAYK